MKYILKLIGFEIKPKTELYHSILTFTNESWLDSIQRRNQTYRYYSN